MVANISAVVLDGWGVLLLVVGLEGFGQSFLLTATCYYDMEMLVIAAVESIEAPHTGIISCSSPIFKGSLPFPTAGHDL